MNLIVKSLWFWSLGDDLAIIKVRLVRQISLRFLAIVISLLVVLILWLQEIEEKEIENVIFQLILLIIIIKFVNILIC